MMMTLLLLYGNDEEAYGIVKKEIERAVCDYHHRLLLQNRRYHETDFLRSKMTFKLLPIACNYTQNCSMKAFTLRE